jgi:hypothetical protein
MVAKLRADEAERRKPSGTAQSLSTPSVNIRFGFFLSRVYDTD